MRLTLTTVAAGVLLLVAGCSEDSQQRYERAAANVEAAKQARAEAQKAVAKKKELDAAEARAAGAERMDQVS